MSNFYKILAAAVIITTIKAVSGTRKDGATSNILPMPPNAVLNKPIERETMEHLPSGQPVLVKTTVTPVKNAATQTQIGGHFVQGLPVWIIPDNLPQNVPHQPPILHDSYDYYSYNELFI